MREIVEGIRAEAPGLRIGVRLSAIDLVPFKPDPAQSAPGALGPGIPEDVASLLPYKYAFGVDQNNPVEFDLTEPKALFEIMRRIGVRLVNVTAASPYYNPHVTRPASYPPSDGYHPPEDPLIGVMRQIKVVRALKESFPDFCIMSSGFTYLQEFLPNVAQGWSDVIGIGRMVLAYPEMPRDVLEGRGMQKKRLCRTFSDCTTAPRNNLVSGCYPLDPFYKKSEQFKALAAIKKPAKIA
jgi:2,4-dienoyl-CoA reductase-like NADH-dependent reductase (Old Yellow Enzyme family)